MVIKGQAYEQGFWLESLSFLYTHLANPIELKARKRLGKTFFRGGGDVDGANRVGGDFRHWTMMYYWFLPYQKKAWRDSHLASLQNGHPPSLVFQRQNTTMTDMLLDANLAGQDSYCFSDSQTNRDMEWNK